MYTSKKEKTIFDILEIYKKNTPAIYLNISNYIKKSLKNTPRRSLIVKKHSNEEINKIKLKALNHPDLIENNKLLSQRVQDLLKKKYCLLNKNA